MYSITHIVKLQLKREKTFSRHLPLMGISCIRPQCCGCSRVPGLQPSLVPAPVGARPLPWPRFGQAGGGGDASDPRGLCRRCCRSHPPALHPRPAARGAPAAASGRPQRPFPSLRGGSEQQTGPMSAWHQAVPRPLAWWL